MSLSLPLNIKQRELLEKAVTNIRGVGKAVVTFAQKATFGWLPMYQDVSKNFKVPRNVEIKKVTEEAFRNELDEGIAEHLSLKGWKTQSLGKTSLALVCEQTNTAINEKFGSGQQITGKDWGTKYFCMAILAGANPGFWGKKEGVHYVSTALESARGLKVNLVILMQASETTVLEACGMSHRLTLVVYILASCFMKSHSSLITRLLVMLSYHASKLEGPEYDDLEEVFFRTGVETICKTIIDKYENEKKAVVEKFTTVVAKDLHDRTLATVGKALGQLILESGNVSADKIKDLNSQFEYIGSCSYQELLENIPSIAQLLCKIDTDLRANGAISADLMDRLMKQIKENAAYEPPKKSKPNVFA